MIKLDFFIFATIYLGILFFAILLRWILDKPFKYKDLQLEDEGLYQCEFCTYFYFDYSKEAISTCPKCGSYNRKEDNQ